MRLNIIWIIGQSWFLRCNLRLIKKIFKYFQIFDWNFGKNLKSSFFERFFFHDYHKKMKQIFMKKINNF